MEHFKLGIFSWFGFLLPLARRLELIKSAGFDSTILWWEDEEGGFPVPKGLMPGMARDLGLSIENIHAPFNNCNDFWSDSASKRQSVIDMHKTWIEDCRKYNIPVMVMHITDGRYPPAFSQDGVRAMEQIARYAEEFNIRLAVENTACQEYVTEVLAQVPSPCLGFCYDSSHDWLLAQEKGLMLEQHKERLFAVHFSDNDEVDDRHWLPGEGNVDWRFIGRAFPYQSFTGALTLEVHPKPEDLAGSPEAFLSKAYERAKMIKGLMGSKP